jgi:ubiquinone/menaquinone biosynthesis C-methylase UbiE
MASGDRPAHRVFAALYDPVTAGAERRIFPEHREYLVAGLRGRVLDLGAGTGAMFPYFAVATDAVPGIELVAVEPDPHMRRRATERATALDLDVDLVEGTAAALPFRDDAFDVVVAAMGFCTVPDVGNALSEVARVLAPDGEVRFLEHVRGRGWYGRLQAAIAPAWRVAVGGCHLDRETGERFRAHPALAVSELQQLSLPTYPATPFVRGTLEPRAEG